MRSRLLLVAALVLGAATPVVGATAACAGSGERAALVVDTGSGTFNYCVELTDDSVSGLELIELANDQHGLQYRFGEGGQAVCMLANVGAEGDDCFGEYPDFWGFWRGDGDGGWTWSSVGAGSTLVRDGDIQGWSWGRGQDGTSHPRPPETTFEDVCPSTPRAKSDDVQRRDRRDPAGGAGSTDPSTDSSDGNDAAVVRTPDQRKERPRPEEPPRDSGALDGRRKRRTATGSEAPAGADTEGYTTAAEEAVRQGLPAAGLIALVLVGALGAAGAVATRRRKY